MLTKTSERHHFWKYGNERLEEFEEESLMETAQAYLDLTEEDRNFVAKNISKA
jgi:hypothetical protein